MNAATLPLLLTSWLTLVISCGGSNSDLTAGAGASGTSDSACAQLRGCCATMPAAQSKGCLEAAQGYESTANSVAMCNAALSVYQQTGSCSGAGGSAGSAGGAGTGAGGMAKAGSAGQGGSGAQGGTAGSNPGCGKDLADCGGLCVDLKSNIEHCGNCATKCGQDQSCEQASCKSLPKTCPCPIEAYCDLATNSCKPGCLADKDCSAGRYCDDSSRSCKVGCRDDSECGANATCNLSSRACDCVGGSHRCSGACVLNNSVEHCGGLCTPCAGTSHGSATCDAASCGLACESSYHLCSGNCLSNQSTNSCGASCSPCPTDPNGEASCSNGTCQIQCHSGAHKEGSTCVLDETCAGQSCSGHGQCSVQGGKTLCTCDVGFQAQAMSCIAKSCQTDTQCPLEFWCDTGACAPGCHADETRCPDGNACRSDNGWVCSNICYQANTGYPSYDCKGTDWACLGNSRCRHLCTTDGDCTTGDKCATFAINYYGWTEEPACVKNCNTAPGECGEAYDNDQGACTCAADGICRDPTSEECRLPNYIAL